MYLCLRVDLDYVPWDSPDAGEFGHGEPATLLRLLELAAVREQRFHFFASNRVLRAFPTEAEAILNRGHALDWFCKHPLNLMPRYEEAVELFGLFGHHIQGLCVRAAWPGAVTSVPDEVRFISSSGTATPAGVRHFPVETKSDREASRGGLAAKKWAETLKAQLRELASRNRGATVVVRPQVLAKYDPKLLQVRDLLEFGEAIGMSPRTLRELL